MTGATIVIRQYVANFFTRGQSSIVTELAVIRYSCMFKRCRKKTCRLVTHTAILTGRNMRSMFTDGDNPIVTNSAIVHHTGVIETGTGKGRGVMTD